MLPKLTNNIDFINTRLRTNGCALSSRKIFYSAPLFLNTENMEFRNYLVEFFSPAFQAG
jgi:hypothetical protein